MAIVVILVAALLAFAVGYRIWRLVTLPWRAARSYRTVKGAVQQRQADKAAGRPVAPINFVALAGIVLAIGGMVVARTTSAIYGLGMIVIGMGVLLLGAKMVRTGPGRTTPNGSPLQQLPNPGGYDPSLATDHTAPCSPVWPPAAPSAPAASRQIGRRAVGATRFSVSRASKRDRCTCSCASMSVRSAAT